jgi:hypothetical protein
MSRVALAADGTEGRREPRDEVHHRARAHGPDGATHPLLLVNMSPHGLMARGDLPYPPGAVIRVTLPLVGEVAAEIRWSLGGRIGCRLHGEVPAAHYPALLAMMQG